MTCFQFGVLPANLSPEDWPEKMKMLVTQETGRDAPGILSIYDDKGIKRFELSIDTSQGYQCRAGLELPRAGLRLMSAWGEDGRPIKLRALSIPLR